MDEHVAGWAARQSRAYHAITSFVVGRLAGCTGTNAHMRQLVIRAACTHMCTAAPLQRTKQLLLHASLTPSPVMVFGFPIPNDRCQMGVGCTMLQGAGDEAASSLEVAEQLA